MEQFSSCLAATEPVWFNELQKMKKGKGSSAGRFYLDFFLSLEGLIKEGKFLNKHSRIQMKS
jgi:hypothetical protein